MLRRLVVGVDGSAGGRHALEWAAEQAAGGRLTVVHGFDPGAELLVAVAQVSLDDIREQHRRALEQTWTAGIERPGLAVDERLVDDRAADALLQIADETDAQAIVVGQHGNGGWSRHHLGEVPGKLLHRSDRPVIVVNDEAPIRPLEGPVVAAVRDPKGGEPDRAVRWAAAVAADRRLALRLVHVVEPLTYIDESATIDLELLTGAAARALELVRDTLADGHPGLTIETRTLAGPPVARLVDEGRDAALLVVGSHRLGPILGFITGSVARHLPTVTPAPVAVVPVS